MLLVIIIAAPKTPSVILWTLLKEKSRSLSCCSITNDKDRPWKWKKSAKKCLQKYC